ncbi:MAG: hypothetical protein P5702_12405 [Limnospira sp. PMC 1291.21]|uniref:dual OB domain-containing protein n=1 Tax=unclassified Limnospira TaxID=2642885 RepID=UPI0028E0D276|nr:MULTISPECIES: hypothetical protein [unclassified Limnospira]MDT9178226.1 hypothetical protein [Limnospira sp. PMC 1238.20]MDT9192100.1 hypothetical protein [Limnospira sp. PMC 1245.20]MDT9203696.1 hypothetical protein [Limnospira sp. PMC 1243.20]MDT9207447.1 hypothetical protein [Limnospira sp. PMC 1252.20]MDT9214084.1 hypothetical protein [Limnospira sp. PMC 1256.20]
MMAKLICLANSRKHNDRCIAGIEISTGKWVRPVTRLDDGRIPVNMSQINGRLIQPLDIVDIPLSDTGNGYEYENRLILRGSWKHIGRVSPMDVVCYCDDEIIHSHCHDWLNAIPYSYISSLPRHQRRTLQIVKVDGFKTWCNNYGKWKGEIPLEGGNSLVLNVTDPELCTKLDNDYILSPECLVVLSLSQPWKKRNSDDQLLCYRLVVAVLEL